MINYCIHGGKKLILLGIVPVLLGAPVMPPALSMATGADKPQSVVRIDEQRLVGHWVRPDGGYILELKEVTKDGKLRAEYFNPTPIKVFRAKRNRKEGLLNVYVELRDVNYPGSKYNLQYDAASDRLIGTYFQAVQGETYDVEFLRGK